MAAPTCRDVIARAMKRLGALGAGASPTADDGVDYLATLQSLYDGWVESGDFGRLTDTIATADRDAFENERVRSDGFTIALPLTIEDDYSGENRAPRDLSLIVVVSPPAAPTRHLYDANLGAWVSLDALAASSAAPLASRNLMGLASCLAIAISDDTGFDVRAGTAALAAQFKSQLSGQPSIPRTAANPEYF